MRLRRLKRSYFSLPYGHRVFVATTTVAAVFMVVAGFAGLAYLPTLIAALNFAGACAYGVIAYLAFVRRKFAGLYLKFFLVTLALLVSQQINHAGFDGSVPVILMATVVVLLSISDASRHRIVLVVMLALAAGLFFFERAFPQFIQPYRGEAERRLDIFLAVMVSILAVWAVVSGLRRNFEIERENLHRANVRLREVARKLRSARTAADLATRARKSFLSTVSHEIRTPLNSIIGLAHLFQADQLSPVDQSSLKTIRFSAEHLLSLINDILDYSRLDSGVVEPEVRLIHVEEWLNDLIETFRPSALKNRTELKLTLPDSHPVYIYSDSSRLTQILTNLIGNAIKFSSDGSVTLMVRTRDLGPKIWAATFEVSDTGVGIPTDRLESIFDEFTQAEAHTYRQFGGTGLGLSIVRRLVELFGGEIRVESTVDEGSRFIVDLDFVLRDVPDAPVPADANQTNAGVTELPDESALLNGKRALVVEDFEMNRVIAERFLQRWGLDVVTVASGGEAVALVEEQIFDIILMDIQMPGLDGYETTRLIRALGGPCARTPIIALTAASLPEEREQAFAAGMTDYVAKPFRPEELRHALLRNLSR